MLYPISESTRPEGAIYRPEDRIYGDPYYFSSLIYLYTIDDNERTFTVYFTDEDNGHHVVLVFK